MQTHPYWIPFAVAATLMGTVVVPAQNWRTVDDFALATGDAEAHGVAVDAAGRVYVVGTANGHGIVRYSADGGTNWVTRDDFLYPSITNNVFNAITINHQGYLFVGGASGGHWIVRRSTDQGVTWAIVDDFWRPRNGPEEGTNAAVYSLSSDGQGRVYGAGLMRRTGPSYNNWWIRRSGVEGTNWDAKLLLFSGYTEVSQITWGGEDVYVTGSINLGDFTTGLILRSGDHGVTWSTNFEAIQDVYYAITSDSVGNVYSAGNRWSSNSYDWLVRKAAPDGTNWTILDRVSYGDSSGDRVDQASPSSIAVDAAGDVSVTGQLREPWVIYGTNGTTYGGNQFWFTRQYSVATGEWNTTDLFSYSTNSTSSTNTHAIANGTAIAPDGSRFAVGYGTSESGQHRWVVRKREAFNSRPRLQIALGNGSVAVSWPAFYTNSILQWSDSAGANPLWLTFAGTVCVTNGQNTATFDQTPGVRFFRLKSMAGQ